MKKHLIFLIADKRYGLPLGKVKEVIALTPITPLPGVPDYYKGMINLRGQIVSIIDLRMRLKFPVTANVPKKTSILITHIGQITVGCIVDEVTEVVAYQDEQLKFTELDRSEPGYDGIYGIAKSANAGDDLTLLIDLEGLLKGTSFKIDSAA